MGKDDDERRTEGEKVEGKEKLSRVVAIVERKMENSSWWELVYAEMEGSKEEGDAPRRERCARRQNRLSAPPARGRGCLF